MLNSRKSGKFGKSIQFHLPKQVIQRPELPSHLAQKPGKMNLCHRSDKTIP